MSELLEVAGEISLMLIAFGIVVLILYLAACIHYISKYTGEINEKLDAIIEKLKKRKGKE